MLPTDRVELPALPISVADAILDEVSTLPKPALALLRAAAILGTDSRRGLRSSWLRSMKVKDSLPSTS